MPPDPLDDSDLADAFAKVTGGALGPAAGAPSADPIGDAFKQVTSAPAVPSTSTGAGGWFRRGAAMLARGGLPVLGGILAGGADVAGDVAAAPETLGASLLNLASVPAAYRLGTGAGGAAGEALGEAIEGEPLSTSHIAIAALSNALAPGARTVGQAVARQALIGGGTSLANDTADEGISGVMSDPEAAHRAELSALLQGAGGGLAHYFAGPEGRTITPNGAPESTVAVGPRRVALSGPPPDTTPLPAPTPGVSGAYGPVLPSTTGITTLDQILGIDPSRTVEQPPLAPLVRRPSSTVVREAMAPTGETAPTGDMATGGPEVPPGGPAPLDVTPQTRTSAAIARETFPEALRPLFGDMMEGGPTAAPTPIEAGPPQVRPGRTPSPKLPLTGTFPSASDELDFDESSPAPTPATTSTGPASPVEGLPDVLQRILGGEEPPEDLSGLNVQDPDEATLNASGESAASLEALHRQSDMAGRGEQYTVYDRFGNKRPIIGPDAVDYRAQPGETFGVTGPGGFSTFDDAGGQVPEADKAAAPTDPLASMPGPLRDLYTKLQPQWAQTVADQAGDGIPFTIDPTETPDEFSSRVMSANPRELMGPERAARKAVEAAPTEDESGDEGGQGGYVQHALLRELGIPALTAALGAPVGAALDPNHPTEGALFGAGTGLLGAEAGLHGQGATLFRHAALLSSPLTVGKKIASDLGSALTEATTRALSGDTATAGRIIKEVFNPDTIQAAANEWQHPSSFTSHLPANAVGGGPLEGLVNTPSRAMGAVTGAMRDAYTRAGLSPEDIERLTFINQPTSTLGQGLDELGQHSGLLDFMVPFTRTAISRAEQGLDYFPGVAPAKLAVRGMFSQDAPPLTGTDWARSMAKQVPALAAFLTGATAAPEEPSTSGKLEDAAWGPLYMAHMAGKAYGQATRGRNPNAPAETNALIQSVLQQYPFADPSGLTIPDALAQFVPNAGEALSSRPADEYDTTDHGVFGPSLAKIPVLNDALLAQRPPRVPR